MATRWQLTVVALCMLLAISSAHADIYRWDNGEVIPGTEGIEPGPGCSWIIWRWSMLVFPTATSRVRISANQTSRSILWGSSLKK